MDTKAPIKFQQLLYCNKIQIPKSLRFQYFDLKDSQHIRFQETLIENESYYATHQNVVGNNWTPSGLD